MGRTSTVEERRAEILKAARRLLLRPGATDIGIGDVAGELDLTSNAVRYYYRTVDHLMEDMYDLAIERFYTRRIDAIADIADAGERLAVTISAGLPSGRDDTEWTLMWRALIAGTLELNRAALGHPVYHRQAQMYQQILDEGAEQGQFVLVAEAVDISRTLMALEDYLGFRVVAGDPTFDRPAALRLVRQYAELATSSRLPLPD